MGRLLGLLLKQKPPQSQPGFAKCVNFPTSRRHLLILFTLSSPEEHYWQVVHLQLCPPK